MYMHTHVSHFISMYMHRKTKETDTKMLKVNFLWVAKLGEVFLYLCAFLYFPQCSVS